MGHDHDHDDHHHHKHHHDHAHHHDHEHHHDHADAHGHAEGHQGAAQHGLPATAGVPSREPLREGAGVGKTLFFDAFSGVAGDMTVAALLDLGVPMLVIEDALAQLALRGYHLHRGQVRRSGIVATTFQVHVDGHHPERSYGAIERLLAESSLAAPVRELAQRIFSKLAHAEANVHQMPLREVHFHEVGGIDAIVDIVGAAAALTWLGAEVVASPLPMGHGFVRARHGILPLPAPAVVDCLRGVPTYAVDLDAELVTPTGAAILATVAQRFERWPSFAPQRVGWGGGQRELPDRPNLLRLVVGDESADELKGSAARGEIVQLETNVDDMSGELAAHALRVLLAAGALDAWAIPIIMKKGRPALTLAVLCAASLGPMLASLLMRETSSIGVRWSHVERIERPRHVVQVSTPFGTIPVKISSGPYGAPQIKPEFDACAAAATEAGVPVREVILAALHAARSAALR
jgi:uncharacterized protein (TIGR00299 family) protein